MKNNIEILKRTALFSGLKDHEIESMLSCLSATKRDYGKNEFIFRRGDRISTIGIVLKGSVHIVEEDFWGNRSILLESRTGESFGEGYASMNGSALLVSVIAPEPCTVMFLDIGRVLTTCKSACVFHVTMVGNLVSELAVKNMYLTHKLSHMSKRTTREKLLSYLSDQARRSGSPEFKISFNRQQLADYLCVDRSAMSNELGRLRDEGTISFNKNQFELKINH